MTVPFYTIKPAGMINHRVAFCGCTLHICAWEQLQVDKLRPFVRIAEKPIIVFNYWKFLSEYPFIYHLSF